MSTFLELVGIAWEQAIAGMRATVARALPVASCVNFNEGIRMWPLLARFTALAAEDFPLLARFTNLATQGSLLGRVATMGLGRAAPIGQDVYKRDAQGNVVHDQFGPVKTYDAQKAGDLEQQKRNQESAAQFSRIVDTTTSAISNRFLPLVESVLPLGLGKLVDATAGVVNSFVERGRELARFSPELQGSKVYNRIQGLQADQREAQALGGETARLDVATTDVWIEIRDAVLPIKKWLISNLADFMEWLKGQISNGIDFTRRVELWIEYLNVIIADATKGGGELKKTLTMIQNIIDNERRIREAERARGKIDNLADALIDASRQKPPEPQRLVPIGPNRFWGPAMGF
jgi:hypothetical protein